MYRKESYKLGKGQLQRMYQIFVCLNSQLTLFNTN